MLLTSSSTRLYLNKRKAVLVSFKQDGRFTPYAVAPQIGGLPWIEVVPSCPAGLPFLCAQKRRQDIRPGQAQRSGHNTEY